MSLNKYETQCKARKYYCMAFVCDRCLSWQLTHHFDLLLITLSAYCIICHNADMWVKLLNMVTTYLL